MWLYCSEDQTQREREKNKLEKAYKESDRKLDKQLQGASQLKSIQGGRGIRGESKF